jgi:benzil reductase ((S)-benzoin forming)
MTDRCVVVTGVSKGLGEAIAANLLARGFDVVGIGRSASPRLASPAFRLECVDLAEADKLASTVDGLFAALAARSLASIAVINNAAVAGPVGTFGILAPGEIADALTVNLVAPAIIANAFVRVFRGLPGDRRLINVSSGAASNPIAGAGVYNVAKAGLEMLTKALAVELGPSGLRAITVRPGVIDTPMQSYIRSQPAQRMPSLAMFQGFHDSGLLVPPDVTASKIVDRLVVAPIENGRTYDYAQL